MSPKMRILYEGVKNFTQRHVSLNIMIIKYDDCDECFEIIAYDIISWVEIPRVYINIWALNALISKRKIVNGPKTITSLSDIQIDESEQVELLLSRLVIKSNTAIRVVELTFESFDHDRVCVKGKLVNLDMVQVKPPDLETYALPASHVLRAKTFDQMLKEKEKAKKKEHDKELMNNVIKIFNTERHVELRAPKAMTEDERALIQMRKIQFDLDFQLKPFDRELARSRWLKAINRILYSILYVKILNRLDVYQWFTKPKDAGDLDLRNAKNLKYRSRASFTDDDYMYGGVRKKDDSSEYRLSHRDDSHILESFNPIAQTNKPFKAFNYGPYVPPSGAGTSLTKGMGLSSLPSISLPHIGDVVRTLAPVLDHAEEQEEKKDLLDRLGSGSKQHGMQFHSYHHTKVVQPYQHEDHDYFPCNKFHPHHINYQETHEIHRPEDNTAASSESKNNDSGTVAAADHKQEQQHPEVKEQQQEEENDVSDPLSPRSPRFRLLPTLREAPAGMLPAISVDLHATPSPTPSSSRSGSSSSHATPSYASSRLHAAVGEGALHGRSPVSSVGGGHHEETRRHSVGGKLAPMDHHSGSHSATHANSSHHHDGHMLTSHSATHGGSSAGHHHHSSDRRHSVDNHAVSAAATHQEAAKKLSPLASERRHSTSVASPSGVSHGPSISPTNTTAGSRDTHTSLPSIGVTNKHSNHIHGLKLVKKVGSFKMSASEKHDLLVASVGGASAGAGGSQSDKPTSPSRSNHLRVLKDLKTAQQVTPVKNEEQEDDLDDPLVDWGTNDTE